MNIIQKIISFSLLSILLISEVVSFSVYQLDPGELGYTSIPNSTVRTSLELPDGKILI